MRYLAAALAVSLIASHSAPADSRAQAPVGRMTLPDGFRAELYANVPDARSLLVVPDLSAVLVGSRGDSIHAIVDEALDGRAERVVRLRSDLSIANGIAWKDGSLYVAEQPRIVRFAAPNLEAISSGRPEVLFDRLPDDPHHGWRYARFGPDGQLYVGVGAPCNVCRVSGLEGTIIRLDPTGGREPEVFARGVRNTVGFDFRPETGELWFTDNGSDWLGDDIPPDELNHAPRPGMHFGFPWYGGGHIRTPEFKDSEAPPGVTFPVVPFRAHVAALGIRFYEGAMFPPEYRGDAFVAQHGSWNRTVPDGYRVMRVRFGADGRPTGADVFASGFLRGNRAWGRPVDVAVLPDGSLLVSDDRQDAVYRITYESR